MISWILDSYLHRALHMPVISTFPRPAAKLLVELTSEYPRCYEDVLEMSSILYSGPQECLDGEGLPRGNRLRASLTLSGKTTGLNDFANSGCETGARALRN